MTRKYHVCPGIERVFTHCFSNIKVSHFGDVLSLHR
jgi:hypothetical protein